jgi:RNA polymerase sigma factor (sigma-70 family)
MSDFHPSVYDLAASVSNTIYKRYKAHVEREDLVQECYSWATSRAEWLSQQLSEENPEQRVHNESRIAWQMLRNIERYARKEKASRSGYQTNDEVYYDTATFGQLLPFVITSIVDNTVLEQAHEMIRDGQPKGSSSPSEGGNLLASLLDIKQAFLKLETADRTVLIKRYHENLTLAQIAEELECAVSSADRRCNSALRRLQNNLGGQSPWR